MELGEIKPVAHRPSQEMSNLILLCFLAICLTLCQATVTSTTSCETAGHSCSDCKTLNFCANFHGGSVTSSETCKPGEVCHEGACKVGVYPGCDLSVTEYEFVCHQSGLFPHPHDCKKYFMCTVDSEKKVIEAPVAMDCEDGYAYDSMKGFCDVKLTGACPASMIVGGCKNVGDTGPMPNNPYIFYYCLPYKTHKYMVRLFRCVNSQRFLGKTCTDPIANVLPGTVEICDANGIYANEGDCTSYITCTEGSPPSFELCERGEKFNRWTQLCEPFEC